MLLNHKGNTLIESLFALSIYLIIVVYFVGSLTALNKSQLRFRYAQENSNKQELRIVEEGDDLQSKLKEALRLMIVLNVPSIIRVLKVPVVSYNQDIAVGAKQLADYLLVSKIKTYSEDIGYYDEKGEENTIIFDKRRLVKTPGYEILITDIDDIIFFEKDAYMYMTITRGQQKYTYMICDLYRKQEDYVEE